MVAPGRHALQCAERYNVRSLNGGGMLWFSNTHSRTGVLNSMQSRGNSVTNQVVRPQRVATAGPESVVSLTLWPAALCTSLLVPNPVPGIEMPLLVPDPVPGCNASLVPDLVVSPR